MNNLTNGKKTNQVIENKNNSLGKYLFCIQGEVSMLEQIVGKDLFAFIKILVENGNIINYKTTDSNRLQDSNYANFQYLYSTDISLPELAIITNFPAECIVEFKGISKFAIEKNIKLQ